MAYMYAMCLRLFDTHFHMPLIALLISYQLKEGDQFVTLRARLILTFRN